jgi:hypothetical protein
MLRPWGRCLLILKDEGLRPLARPEARMALSVLVKSVARTRGIISAPSASLWCVVQPQANRIPKRTHPRGISVATVLRHHPCLVLLPLRSRDIAFVGALLAAPVPRERAASPWRRLFAVAAFRCVLGASAVLLAWFLNARARAIRPFELHGVTPQRLRLPRANVADLSIVVVVPTLPGNRIRNRFAQFV